MTSAGRRICRLCSMFVTTITVLAFSSADASSFQYFLNTSGDIGFSRANSVDDRGEVVVGAIDVGGVWKAFFWTATTGVQVIEGTQEAHGISGDGNVVVGMARDPSTNVREPFRWSAQQGLQIIPPPPGTHTQFFPAAIATTYDGSVIVGQTEVRGTTRAFVWRAETGTSVLEFDVQPRNSYGGASDVSSDGKVIVGAIDYESEFNSFLWTEETGLRILDVGSAYGVSADGTVVVGGGLGLHSFRWTELTGVVDLQTWPNPGPAATDPLYSNALAATGAGEAIVGSANGTLAFLWTEANGMESLPWVLENRFGLGGALQGWRLEEATDITPDGKTIVGNGISPDGVTAGWIVRLDHPIFVPEPSALGMTLIIFAGATSALKLRNPSKPQPKRHVVIIGLCQSCPPRHME